MSLHSYVLKRLLMTIPVLFGVTVVTFLMVHAIPGDPVDYILQFNTDAGPEVEEQMRQDLNLDQPIWTQYWVWLTDAVTLDFGESIISDRDVTAVIAERLPATILLGVAAWVIALGLALPAGIYAALNKGALGDEVSRVGALFGIATPNFWLGLMLLYVFAVNLGWFRVLPPADIRFLDPSTLKYVFLPAITIGTASTAVLMRLVRSSMIEELNKEYVTMARAKGLRKRTVIFKHVLRNSLISVVTVAVIQIAFIIDGTVVIEEVFSWPGMGRLLIEAIFARDFPLIQASVLLIGVTIVFANLIVDILYAWLDPRIRY